MLTKGQAGYVSGNFNYDEFSQGILYHCMLYFLQGLNIFVLTCLSVSFFIDYYIRDSYSLIILLTLVSGLLRMLFQRALKVDIEF